MTKTKYIKHLGITACATTIFSLSPCYAEEGLVAETNGKIAVDGINEAQPKIQIAILLDTSGSMNGLIEQTKTQLWKIVNTFIDARQGGKVPFVEVALYEYGKDSVGSDNQWVRQIQPMTRDLDIISKELFTLQTNGGEEYCGVAIERATCDLKWDASEKVYKVIFIAGNEPFTQGPVLVADSVSAAIAKGVVVNTIHCGNEQAGIAGGWKQGAMLAEGKFLTIDHNSVVVHIDAPQDAEILKLNQELNKTYIGYGALGAQRKGEQIAQDKNANAKAASGAELQRSVSKASSNYWNGSWDLVDASSDKKFDVAKLKKEELPKEMQLMTAEQRKNYIALKAKQRAEIQAKIMELNKLRREFIAQKRKAQAKEAAAATLDDVITQTVREQAMKKGFVFQ